MGRRWVVTPPTQWVPTELVEDLRLFQDVALEPAGAALDGLARALELSSAALLLRQDPLSALVSAALAALRAVLERWLAPQGLHVLVTPSAAAHIWQTLENMEAPQQELPQATGGLGALYAMIEESVADPGDVAAPRYGPDDYVQAVFVVYGTSDLLGLLRTVMLLRRLLGGLSAYPDQHFTPPAPQDLRAQWGQGTNAAVSVGGRVAGRMDIVALPGAQEGQGLAYVRWEPLTALTQLVRLVRGATLTVTAVRLYARTDRAFGPLDIDDALAAHEVWSSTRPGVDVVVPVWASTTGKTWLTASYDLSLDDGQQAPQVLMHTSVGGVVVLDPAALQAPTLPAGKPPDWTAASTVLDLFPGVREQVQGVLDFLTTMEDAWLVGAREDMAQLIELLRGYVAQVQAVIATALDLFESLANVLESLARSRMYAYGVQGTGGTALMLQELYAALFDPATANRPPWVRADDYAGALVIVGGLSAGAGPAAVAGLRSTFGLLTSLLGVSLHAGSAAGAAPDEIQVSGQIAAPDLAQVHTLLSQTQQALSQWQVQAPRADPAPVDISLRSLYPESEC